MGILIIIVVATLVIAGVGAGVYVLVFRAKHKQEVMANSQMMGNNLPAYGVGSDQPGQVAGQAPLGNMVDPNQGFSPVSPVMNDITGNGAQNGVMSDMQAPQPQVSPTPDMPVADMSQDQPTVNRNFPGSEPAPEMPADNNTAPMAGEPSMPLGTLDLNQVGPDAATGGNFLDDTETVSPVTEIAENPTDTSIDSSVNDSMVPVTEDPLEQVEEKVGESEVNLGTQEREELNGTAEPVAPQVAEEPPVAPMPPTAAPAPDFPDMAQPASPQPQPEFNPPVPEAPVDPVSAPADFPPPPAAPQPPQAPQTGIVDDNQGTGAQEMHI